MAELPGKQMPNPPPLPGQGAVQPTPAQRAAIETQWNTMASIRPALAEIIAVFDRHPELVAWARGSQAATMRVVDRP